MDYYMIMHALNKSNLFRINRKTRDNVWFITSI